MSSDHSPAWAGQLLSVLRLYAEYAHEGRDAPVSYDAFAALNMRSNVWTAAQQALLRDGRLCEARVKRRGLHRDFMLTQAGWASIGQRPPQPGNRGPAVRQCLCCRRGFDSFGPGNRICPVCATAEAFQGGSLAW